jgi:hypothetical protein
LKISIIKAKGRQGGRQRPTVNVNRILGITSELHEAGKERVVIYNYWAM